MQLLKGVWSKEFSVAYTGATGQCAAFSCDMVRFKNASASGTTAVVYVGGYPPSYPLNDGDDTGWIPTQEMDSFYYAGQEATGTLHYMAIWE